MTTTTITKTAREIVAAGTSNAAGATTRGRLDLQTAMGGLLTMKINNAGTLGAQCEGRVLVSHNATMPAAASAGADWKTIWKFGGGITSGVTTEQSFEFGPGIMSLEVEFTGNTTNACTVEAYCSEVTNAVNT